VWYTLKYFHPKVISNVGQKKKFVPSFNRVSNQVYAYMPFGFYFFKNLYPPPTKQFLKVNIHPHLIIGDLKFSNIHNQTLLEENNNVGCLSITWINNDFISKLCYL